MLPSHLFAKADTDYKRGLQNELNDQKASHHAAIELFQDRFGELRRLLSDQGQRVATLENENAALREARPAQLDESTAEIENMNGNPDLLPRLHFTTKQTLTGQIDVLLAAQNQQDSVIERLPTSSGALARRAVNSQHTNDELKLRQDQVQTQLHGITIDVAALIRAYRDQATRVRTLRIALVTHQEQGHDDHNNVAPLR